MAKRAQIASLAISGGGAKRLYLRRAEHLEQRSIAQREGDGDGDGDGDGGARPEEIIRRTMEEMEMRIGAEDEEGKKKRGRAAETRDRLTP